MKKIISRLNQPVSPFFKKLRNIGIALTAISVAVLSAPVALPVAVVTIATYCAVGGSVLGAVSQLTQKDE